MHFYSGVRRGCINVGSFRDTSKIFISNKFNKNKRWFTYFIRKCFVIVIFNRKVLLIRTILTKKIKQPRDVSRKYIQTIIEIVRFWNWKVNDTAFFNCSVGIWTYYSHYF